jgi:hypothetical protein
VLIVKLFHFMAVSLVSDLVLNNGAMGKQRRPQAHLKSSKINIVARLISVITYGKSTNLDCLLDAPRGIARNFCAWAVEFFVTRLSSSTFLFTPTANNILSAKWSNFKKTIARRSERGLWSNSYCDGLICRNKISAADALITQGVLFQVAIYCCKLWEEFHNMVHETPHHMLRNEYQGPVWNRYVGEVLYLRQEPHGDSDIDDDTNGNNGGNNNNNNNGNNDGNDSEEEAEV